MPTIFTHAYVAAVAGTISPIDDKKKKFWLAGIGCSILPDLDVIAFALGIDYGAMLGHRGLSHSLPFACLVGWLVVTIWFRDFNHRIRRLAIIYFTVLTASHGFFDAFTNGGRGIAFFAPLSDLRYFFQFTPIDVSPIGLHFFTSEYGLRVILSEIKWVWLPVTLMVIGWKLISLARKST